MALEICVELGLERLNFEQQVIRLFRLDLRIKSLYKRCRVCTDGMRLSLDR